MTSAIEVVVGAHWVNGWFVYALARPIVAVDETEHAVRWNKAALIHCEAGAHRVAVGIRYRGWRRVLGTVPVDVRVDGGTTLRLRAVNGPLNSDPWRISER
ncbi:hypothetical protein HH308_20650 [Gordonia sp. TBRC 11910]|uniref:Uncharacterized protein n=1 Tax=Gordonia asplenii TaxID=2725283 RepID=A0A848KZ15_9ACTN|nr:hypothetical protein [Gordonia asplenii]NMO03629.1 hypothetical protein [Gordonia asplenii]